MEQSRDLALLHLYGWISERGFIRSVYWLAIRGLPHVLTIAFVGFDGSLMGGINAMDQYLQFFHYKEVGASTGISEYLSRDVSMPYAALAIMAPPLNRGLSLTPLPSLPHVYRG